MNSIYHNIWDACKKRITIWLHQKNNAVALTFDATWGNEYTPLLLQKLKQHRVKATFFISGIWIERYPENFQDIHTQGHEIGNHSYRHPHMIGLSDEEIFQEIEKTEQLSQKNIGKRNRLFRFPYGESNEHLTKYITKMGLIPVLWSIDSLDWKGIDAKQIFKNVTETKELEHGDIILMHNAGEHTVESLDFIIPALKKKGYKIVTVSQLLQSSV